MHQYLTLALEALLQVFFLTVFLIPKFELVNKDGGKTCPDYVRNMSKSVWGNKHGTNALGVFGRGKTPVIGGLLVYILELSIKGGQQKGL